MKFSRLALGTGLLCLIVAGPSWAQDLYQPNSVRQVAFDDDYGYYMAGDEQNVPAAKSPSDAPPPADVATVAPASNNCCARHRCGRHCCRGSGLELGGWLQTGMSGDFEDPHDRYNGPVMTNDRVGDFQMNQAWLFAQRGVNTGGYGFDVGGRVDVLYGTDWRVANFHGRGLEDRLNDPNSLYGLSFPQFYAEFGINDLSIKVGRMTGVLGYESIIPTTNFFYSHNYQLSYLEPIFITGVMGEYKLSDRWTLLGGFHNGVHDFENQNGDLNLQGGVVWTSRDGDTSLGYALDAGRNDPHALQDQYIHSIVFKRQLTDRLQYALQSDYSFTNGITGHNDAEAYGIANYLFYKLNRKWTAGLRVEWFRDNNGAAVMGIGNLPDSRGWMGAPGYAGNFTELTMGLNWKPTNRVAVRPEIRWDWYDGPANPNGAYPYPFDDGNSKKQFTFATDVVISF
ncbi:MAG: porin [Pirellulales bacterium]|nr:porin [Pirellulales bacterium]